jgi:4'-phosphopantetheinyl transferase
VVEVHSFSLDVDAARLRELEGSLSLEERERAARFRFDRDRNRFTVCRGTLRELLGVRRDQRFVYGAYGKPMLAGSALRFNVSHSHGMAMIAISRGREVGCDIERIDPAFVDDKIPERFFSPCEVAALRALPEEKQCHAFFRCWTRKEAYFDVTLAPDQPSALLRGADGWSLYDIEAPDGYVAALVLADQPGITILISSLRSSMMKSGGAARNVSG